MLAGVTSPGDRCLYRRRVEAGGSPFQDEKGGMAKTGRQGTGFDREGGELVHGVKEERKQKEEGNHWCLH